jgi:CheY-like chemotaxis protein
MHPVAVGERIPMKTPTFAGARCETTVAVPPASEGRTPRVLLADDDRGLRVLLAAVLEQERCEVTSVANGVELLRALAGQAWAGYDLVISDVHMPGVDGLQALAHLREAGSKVPVILITALGGRDFEEQARALGAAASLEKPFDLVDLRAVVSRVLEPPPKP